jgi:hypothetical protein
MPGRNLLMGMVRITAFFPLFSLFLPGLLFLFADAGGVFSLLAALLFGFGGLAPGAIGGFLLLLGQVSGGGFLGALPLGGDTGFALGPVGLTPFDLGGPLKITLGRVLVANFALDGPAFIFDAPGFENGFQVFGFGVVTAGIHQKTLGAAGLLAFEAGGGLLPARRRIGLQRRSAVEPRRVVGRVNSGGAVAFGGKGRQAAQQQRNQPGSH